MKRAQRLSSFEKGIYTYLKIDVTSILLSLLETYSPSIKTFLLSCEYYIFHLKNKFEKLHFYINENKKFIF